MSIIRPIVRTVVRSVVSSILGDAVTRFFSIFGGDKNIVLGQVLFPSTSDFTLRVKIRPSAADVGANTTILSQDVIATPRILTSGTDVLRIIYQNLSAGSVTLNSTTPIQAGVDMVVEFVSSATTGTILKINGVPQDSSAGIVDPTFFGIDLIGVRHDDAFFFQGEIYDVEVPNGSGVATYPINESSGLVAADNSFVGAFDQLPRSEWVEGNGVDIFGSFSPVTLAGDFVIEWEEVRGDSLAGNDKTATFGASGAGQLLSINDTGSTNPARVSLSSAPEFNTFNAALSGVSAGDNYSGRFTRESGTLDLFINDTFIDDKTEKTATYVFDQIMQGQTSNQKTTPQGIYRLTDSAGNTYEWRLNEVIDIGGGQGLVKNTGNTGDTYDLTLNNWTPADQTLVTVPTDGIWTAEPVRVER